MDLGHHESHPHVNYFAIFIALCVCTLLSVVFDVVELPGTLLVTLVLAVAVAKALFVMTYFMHLKFEGNWKFVILMPTAILAVGLMVALSPDMAMHYYDYTGAQVKYPKVEHHGAEGHGADAGIKESAGGTHEPAPNRENSGH